MNIDTMTANQLIVGGSFIFNLICLTFSALTCIFSMVAYAKVVGMQNSTHSVQYMPMDPEVERDNKNFVEKQHEDGWATTEASFKEEDKKYRKEVDEYMPQFSEQENDSKIHSF